MEKVPKVSIKQIFAEYFKGLTSYKKLFIFSVLFFTISYILNTIIPYFFKVFFDILGSTGEKSDLVTQLMQVVFIIAIIYLADWLFYRVGFYIYLRIEAVAMSKIKQNSFNYLIKHSHGFFSNNFTGSLVQKINRQARSFERLFDTFIFNFIPLIVFIFGALIMTFFYV